LPAPSAHRAWGRYRQLCRLEEGIIMNLNLSLAPIVSLIAGVLILAMPRLLNYIVAIYLILIGIIGLFGAGSFHIR
jgi:hypothetical protein